MKKRQQGTTDLALFKSLIKALPQNSLYELRNAITSELRSKKYQRGKYNPLFWDYNGHAEKQDRINSILEDDWEDMFSDSFDELDDYYVYAHIDPLAEYITNIGYYLSKEIHLVKPIYIGMGRGDRWLNFKRSKLHSEKLRSLTESGFGRADISYKISTGLNKPQALELESKLILLYGCKASSTGSIMSFYGEPPCLFNSQYEPYPDSWKEILGSHSIKVGA